MIAPFRTRACAFAFTALVLAGCGGGDGNPFTNPPLVDNPPGAPGGRLSFAYFQQCIEPIFNTPLPSTANGLTTTNTCASTGCHDNVNGTGGAFRVTGSAATVDLSNPANTPELIRTLEIYRNFYSAQGETIPGAAAQSRLVNKPLVRGVLHGGGLIFDSEDDPLVKRLRYWISRPAPNGQDEFSSASNGVLNPATAGPDGCNIE
jgi:hypothetical protein